MSSVVFCGTSSTGPAVVFATFSGTGSVSFVTFSGIFGTSELRGVNVSARFCNSSLAASDREITIGVSLFIILK